MLGARVYHRHLHRGGPQETAVALKPVVAHPQQVVHRLVDGVHALVARGVSTAAVGGDVEHH